MNNDTTYFLIEIRRRLLRGLLVFVLVAVAMSFIADRIYYFLALPLIKHLAKDTSLIAISVPTTFLVPFKSALMASLFITAPYLLYQIWGFIAPALYRHERRLVWLLLGTSSILFYAGIIFSYFIILPLVFKFFIYIAPQGVEVQPDISQYYSFILRMFFAFGVAFEVPVAIVLLCLSGVTTQETLAAKRPYIIVIAFIAGMLLTPPDILSQILLALPLWLLFEFGLLLTKLIKRRHLKTSHL